MKMQNFALVALLAALGATKDFQYAGEPRSPGKQFFGGWWRRFMELIGLAEEEEEEVIVTPDPVVEPEPEPVVPEIVRAQEPPGDNCCIIYELAHFEGKSFEQCSNETNELYSFVLEEEWSDMMSSWWCGKDAQYLFCAGVTSDGLSCDTSAAFEGGIGVQANPMVGGAVDDLTKVIVIGNVLASTKTNVTLFSERDC